MQTTRCLETIETEMDTTSDAKIATELSELVTCFENPVCVYASGVASQVEKQGGRVAAFDVRGNATKLSGYRKWDVREPIYVANEFDLILCGADNANVDELFHAMRVVSHFDFDLPIVLVQPEDRVGAVVERMEPFGLKKCATRVVEGRRIAYLANFDLPIF